MKIALLVITCFLISVASALPQEQSGQQSLKILQIRRDFVRSGHEHEYETFNVQTAQAAVRNSSPVPYLTISSVTGDAQTWFLIWYQSFEEIDTLREDYSLRTALATELSRILRDKGDLISGGDTLLAQYRQDLSRGPEIDIAKAHYFSIVIDPVIPGHLQEYEELQKTLRSAHKKAGDTTTHTVYQVLSGTSNGTYLIFTPLHDLVNIKDAAPAQNHKYDDALGDSGLARVRELAANSISSSDSYLYAIRPATSYPLPEWVNADVDFWAPRPGVRH
ncbi:MAG TPA: hypothetical protein VFC63_22360 [Blastocatellia bacterium]|nr:hypothetical protein [Blastocatellia bacterium]